MDTILLVDDSSSNLTVLLETLKGCNYKLLIAKNGETAIRIAKCEHPSLILLDIVMPEMDGYQVCKILKEYPQTSDIAIIFLSALDDIHDKVKGLEMGAMDYISKPFQPEEVLARVATHIKMHRLEMELIDRNMQLKANNERILQAMDEGVLGIDSTGNITFANPATSILIRWKHKDLIKKNISQIILQNQSEDNKFLHMTLLEGKSQHIDHGIFVCGDSIELPVSYSLTPIIDATESKVSGAVIVFTDISEKLRRETEFKSMQNELQNQKDKLTHMSRLSSMGEMASGFAHEVNQPLTAINNYAQACLRLIKLPTPDINTLIEVLNKITIQACRAGDIVSRIKNFVRKPQHVLSTVDCNKLINDIVMLAEVDAKENNVDIHLDLANNLEFIRIDSVQIQQVVLNLIRNAMEAMKNQPNQHLGVWIKTEKYNQQLIKISVIDRGYGLEEGAEKKLFTPFYSTKSFGMGIGLSVCHSIIEAHKGTLNFQRNPNGGTIFYFTLPIVIN